MSAGKHAFNVAPQLVTRQSLHAVLPFTGLSEHKVDWHGLQQPPSAKHLAQVFSALSFVASAPAQILVASPVVVPTAVAHV